MAVEIALGVTEEKQQVTVAEEISSLRVYVLLVYQVYDINHTTSLLLHV